MRKLLRLFSGLLCESCVCGSVEADLASFSANPDRPRCPKCRRNTFRCWSGGERQNSAIRLHARRPGSQRREWQSAKGALRRSRPPRPLSPFPPSPQTRKEHRQERVCALWPPWGVTDGIEPGPATAQLIVKASLDGSSDPPDPRRAVCELRQNAMEPSPALAGFFFFGKLARSATPEVATRDRCTQVRPLRYFSPRAP
jgi:hypothetical protein